MMSCASGVTVNKTFRPLAFDHNTTRTKRINKTGQSQSGTCAKWCGLKMTGMGGLYAKARGGRIGFWVWGRFPVPTVPA